VLQRLQIQITNGDDTSPPHLTKQNEMGTDSLPRQIVSVRWSLGNAVLTTEVTDSRMIQDGGNQSWSASRCYLGVSLGGKRKATTVMIVRVPADNRTWHDTNANQMRDRCVNLLGAKLN
jgi:hypothetical protein